MSDNGNGQEPKKNGRDWSKAPRFGIEKPAIAGPGRPPLSPEVKLERKQLREMLEKIAPHAIETLAKAMKSSNPKNAIRAAEIALSHTVPKLGEVETHDDRPLTNLPESVVGEIIARAVAQSPTNGHSGNGVPA